MKEGSRIPRGIRLRGNSYMVDVTKDGVRRTGTAATLNEAIELQRMFKRKEDVEFAPKNKPKNNLTLKQAVENTLRTPAPEGWADTKYETKAAYNVGIAMEFFGEHTPLESIRESQVDGYVQYLMGMGDANGTINRKLSALSKVMTLAQRQSEGGYYKPVFPRRLRETRGRIRQLSAKEEVALLSWFEKLEDHDARDYTVFLIDTGIRVSEGLGLTGADVVKDEGGLSVMIHGEGDLGTKNGEFRAIPLTKRAAAIIEKRMVNGGKLFPFRTRYVYSRRWDRVRALMGMTEDPQFIPHMLRHTCASRLVQRGVSLKVVQEWLGHKSLSMTMRYSHLYPKDLMNARDILDSKQ